MSALTPAVSAWLARHHGVVTRDDLVRLGLTPGQINSLIRYRRPRAATYEACTGWLGHPRPPSRPWPWPARSLLTSWCPSARPLVCGACVGSGNDGLLHVTIAGRAHRSIPDTVVHRSHRIDAVDVVDRTDGIRVDESAADRLRPLGQALRRADPLDRRAAPPQRCLHHGHAVGDRPAAGRARPSWIGALRAGAVGAARLAQAGRLRPRAPPRASPRSRPASPDPNARQRSGYAEGSSSILTSCGGHRARRSRSTTSPSTAASSTSTTTSGAIASCASWASMSHAVTDQDIAEPARCRRHRGRRDPRRIPRAYGVVEDHEPRQIAEAGQPTWEAAAGPVGGAELALRGSCPSPCGAARRGTRPTAGTL